MDSLDSDLLRTFLVVTQEGSVTAGAERLLRSQSAISTQIKRLETIIGRPVFERHGRGVELSSAGHQLLPVAREITGRLDLAQRELAGGIVAGKLRLGIPDEYDHTKLARIISGFSQHHPQVELEVVCANSSGFPEMLAKRKLDLAIYEVEVPGPCDEILHEEPTCWVASRDHDFSGAKPFPVALFDQACWWRDAAIASLEASGRNYRIVFSSQSISGVMAAIETGIAVGLVARSSLHRGLRVVDASFGLVPTPTSKLVMSTATGGDKELIDAMKAVIRTGYEGKAQP